MDKLRTVRSQITTTKVPLIKRGDETGAVTPEPLVNTNGSSRSIALSVLNSANNAAKARFVTSKQRMTFGDFLKELVDNPRKFHRTAPQHTIDAIDYFDRVYGREEEQNVFGRKVKPFVFTSKPWIKNPRARKNTVSGQDLPVHEIYNTLKNSPEFMIALNGPNATAKSNIIDCLFEAEEQYSLTDEGALYTFEWVFKESEADFADNAFEGLFPVYSGENAVETNPFAIDPNEDHVSIPDDANSNPIFLLNAIPREEGEDSPLKSLLEKLKESDKIPRKKNAKKTTDDFDEESFLSGKVSSSSKIIFEALWKMYDGDLGKVLSHVHVTRYNMSSQNRRGLVLIPAEKTPEAQLDPVTLDIDWDKLPNRVKDAFRSAGLHKLKGGFIRANRGHVCYDDAFKAGDIGRYLFLLRTAEKGKLTVPGPGGEASEEELDTIVWMTVNDSNLELLQEQFQDWPSLKERIKFINVGYERRYPKVRGIFEPQLEKLIPESSDRHVTPNVLDYFALWVAGSYVFLPQSDTYYKENDQDSSHSLWPLVQKLDAFDKVLLYAGDDLNGYRLGKGKPRFSTEDQAKLRRHLRFIADEFNYGVGRKRFTLYEGQRGLSIRDARPILQEAVHFAPDTCLSPVELFEVLDDWIKHGSTFEDEQRKDFDSKTKKAMADLLTAKGLLTSASTSSKESDDKSRVKYPTARELYDLTRQYAVRRIRYDFNRAIKSIKDDEAYAFTLEKYIEHVKLSKRPSVGGKQVVLAEKYHEPPGNTKPNEGYMRRVEEKLLSKSDIINSDEFRSDILTRLGDWRDSNKGNPEYSHLNEIFPDLMDKLRAKNVEDDERRLHEFLYDLQEYTTGKRQAHNSATGAITAEARERIFQTGLEGLRQEGYCDICIPKVLNFAFLDDPDLKTKVFGSGQLSRTQGSGI